MSIKLKVSRKIGSGEISIAPIKHPLKASQSVYVEKNDFFNGNIQLAIEKQFLFIEDINSDYLEIKNSLDSLTIKLTNVGNTKLIVDELKVDIEKGKSLYLNTEDLKFKSLKDALKEKTIEWVRIFDKEEALQKENLYTAPKIKEPESPKTIEVKKEIKSVQVESEPEDDFVLEEKEVKSNYSKDVDPNDQKEFDRKFKEELDSTKTDMKAWDISKQTLLNKSDSDRRALKQVNSQNEALIEDESGSIAGSNGVSVGKVDFNKVDQAEQKEIVERKYVIDKSSAKLPKEGKKRGRKPLTPVGTIKEVEIDPAFVPLGSSAREIDFIDLSGGPRSNQSRKARQNEEVS